MKVLGFPIDKFSRDMLENLTDVQKHEYYLSDESILCWDTPQMFFNTLNDDYVDTENYFYYIINVD